MLNVTFKSFTIIFLILFIVSVSATPLFAQIDTVQATYKYIMGDNDTKTDARNLCFLYAKKLCMEKAGTFVQSQLSVKKRETHSGGYSEVTNQDIQTYSGALKKNKM